MKNQKPTLAKIAALIIILALLAPFVVTNVGSRTTEYGTRPDEWWDTGIYINDTFEGGTAAHGWPCVYQLSDGVYWVVFMWGGNTVGGANIPIICYKESKSDLYSYGYYKNASGENLPMQLVPGNITIGGGFPSRFIGELGTKGDKPQICEDRWGKIWLVYQNASKIVEEKAVLFYKVTEDRGKNWSEAKPIPLGYTGRGGTPVITCTPNNTIVVAWDEGSETGDNGIMFTYTFDNGTTWATPKYVTHTPVSGTHFWPDTEWVELFNESSGNFEGYLAFTQIAYASYAGKNQWVAAIKLTQDLGETWLPDPAVASGGKAIAATDITSTSIYPATGIAQVHVREPNNTGAKNRTLIGLFDKKTSLGYDVHFALSAGNITSGSGTWYPVFSSEHYGGIGGAKPGNENTRGCAYIGPSIWDENETMYPGYIETMYVYGMNLDSYKGGWARGGYWKNWSAYGTVAGNVTDASTGLGIPYAKISVYKPGSAVPVATGTADENGFYVVKALDWEDTGTSYDVEAYAPLAPLPGYVPSGRINKVVYYASNVWQDFSLSPVGAGFEFELEQGWNYICLALANASLTNASALAQAIGPNCTQISNWTGTGFTIYDVATDSGNFDLEAGRGYLVYVTSHTLFSLGGDKISGSVTLTLNPGWNNIGWFNSTTRKASELASEIKYCEAIAAWNHTLARFVTHPKGTSISDFDIERGNGYLIYVTSTSDLVQNP